MRIVEFLMATATVTVIFWFFRTVVTVVHVYIFVEYGVLNF